MSLITATLGRIAAPERRTMAVACGAHVLHDGLHRPALCAAAAVAGRIRPRLCRGRAVARALCRLDGRLPAAGRGSSPSASAGR